MTTFSDIPNEFLVHPTSKDLVLKADEYSVRQSVKNLVNLGIGSKPFHPEIAIGLDRILFEQITPILVSSLRRNLPELLERYEPRIQVLTIQVGELEDSGAVVLTLVYRIVNSQKTQTIDFYFDRIR